MYDAIGLIAQALVAENHLIAARAHLVLQIGMGGTKDQRPLQLLMRINNSPSVPLLAKQGFTYTIKIGKQSAVITKQAWPISLV